MRLTYAFFASSTLLLWGAACTNDFGQFSFGSGGAGGDATTTTTTTTTTTSSGMGGMMTTSSSTTTTTSSGMGGMGGGGPVMCNSPLQCPGTDTDCRIRACENMICGFADRPVGLNCNEMGGTVCDGMGSCVECVADADCTAITNGVCDTNTNTCLPPDCMDGILNGMETDIDCGGGTCNPCINGDDCMLAGDCTSNLCDNMMMCAACTLDTDCAMGEWCDVGVCSPQKILGDACGGDNECTSGFCPGGDGVCCDTSCGSTCEACLMAKTGMADGTCAFVTAGTDPDSECTANTATCTGEFCSGTATSCQPAMANLVCRPVLAGNNCDLQEVCDGVNTGCPADAFIPDGQPGAGIGCGNYFCDGTGVTCPNTCVNNGDCITPSTCQGGTGGAGGGGGAGGAGGAGSGMCL